MGNDSTGGHQHQRHRNAFPVLPAELVNQNDNETSIRANKRWPVARAVALVLRLPRLNPGHPPALQRCLCIRPADERRFPALRQYMPKIRHALGAPAPGAMAWRNSQNRHG